MSLCGSQPAEPEGLISFLKRHLKLLVIDADVGRKSDRNVEVSDQWKVPVPSVGITVALIKQMFR